MSIACVLVTHLPLKAELLRQPTLSGRAVLVVGGAGGQKLVIDRSREARDTVAGMALDQALARCPSATLVEADMPAYRETWERVLDALERRSPIVEDADLGLAYVDLRGLERLYGNDANLLQALFNATPGTYRPRMGVGEGKFPAYAAALHAEPGGAVRIPQDATAFLAPLPVVRLPTSWRVKERLMDFGLESIGSIASLPLSAMQGEFGKEGARLWRLASGRDDEPLLARAHSEIIRQETAFAAPTVSLPAILVALEGLLTRAFTSGLRGRFARVVELEGEVGNGPAWGKRIAFREPVGNRDQALRILRGSLDGIALPAPLESLAITLSGITGDSGRQESLFSDVRRRAQLDDAVRQLRARLGRRPPIYRIREVEPWSRIPERRRALVAYEP
jgi:DNA polymerase-4/protein ImuB